MAGPRTRHRRMGVAAVAAVTFAVAGCGGDDPPVDASGPAAVDGCEAEERPPLQAGAHLIGDADPPVPYSSVPPTSGWHASGALRPGVHDDPLTDPQIVALLEVGQIVAVYDADTLPAEEIATLEELASSTHSGRLNVTPANTELPAPVTLTAWGVLQRCGTVSAEAVTAFVLQHYGRTDAEH